MPQASAELRAEWHTGDGDIKAWEYLKGRGWREHKFVLKPPCKRTPSKKEWRAVDYLCDEWDWAYDL